MDSHHKILHAIQLAAHSHDRKHRLDLLAEAAKAANLLQLEELEYFSKVKFVQEAINQGRGELILIHFPWILAYAERTQRHEIYPELIRLYAWALTTLCDLPYIPKAKIVEGLEDLETRWQAWAPDPLGKLQNRRLVQVGLGDWDAAAESHQMIDEYMRASGRYFSPHDHYSLFGEGNYYEKTGQYSEALEAFYKILRSRHNTMFVSYARTQSLFALLASGRLDEGINQAMILSREVPETPISVPDFGNLMCFWAVTENWEKGLEIMAKTHPLAEENQLDMERAYYQQGVVLLLDRVPPHILDPFPNLKDLSQLKGRVKGDGTLRENYRTQLHAFLTNVDKRNQNQNISGYFRRWETWIP